ncbi:MAG: thioredoxin family protein [Nocardioides sp.]|uniref:TlpA family protein disulfide reductase n=1 Tax=Nocardioides sp. TaxID=35761 RepID=UPI0039E49149
MSTGVGIALVAVVVALGFGGFRAMTDGRFGGTRAVRIAADESRRAGTDGPPNAWSSVAAASSVEPGERATLVQFSSAFCAPCRATRRVLAEIADQVPGVVHVEVDAEQHLDMVRSLGVLRTPTTLVLDRTGVEVARAAGAPRKEQVLAALAKAVD